MPFQMNIEYSQNIPDILNVPRESFEQEARMAMAVKLFEMKRLSSGMAAKLAGVERVYFLLELSKYHVNMIDINIEELKSDIENA